MSGLTISKGFGLVAALAVSGTALFLAYGYKKKMAFLNVRKVNGSWNYVYHLSEPWGNDGGIAVELLSGKETITGGFHLPRLSGRPPKPPPPFSVPGHGATREEGLGEGKLTNCPDAELISRFREEVAVGLGAAAAAAAEDESESSDPSLNSAHSSERIDSVNMRTQNTSGESKLNVGESVEEFDVARGSDFPAASSSLLCQDGQTTEAHSVASAPPKLALVGILISPGNGANGKVGVREKKHVRFSLSVVEPSSSNQNYRRRGGQQLRSSACTSAQEQRNTEVIRTIVPNRPKLFSKGAKYTFPTNSVGRFDYRYSSRAYQPRHL